MAEAGKGLLIPVYYFPPLGMGGVQRILKFIKYLPDFKWYPTVITVKNVQYPAKDTSLLNEIGACRVLRTGSFDPLRIAAKFSRKNKAVKPFTIQNNSGFLRKVGRFISIPDSKIGWVPFAVRKACRIVETGNFKAVLTSSPPLSGHLIGLKLKKKYKLKWVADFRDYWQEEPRRNEPSRLHEHLKHSLVRKIVTEADLVITVSDPITEAFKAEISDLNPDKFITIPNGFDPADFIHKSEPAPDKFVIAYCGTLSPFLSPELFFETIQKSVRHYPELGEKLKIHISGQTQGINLFEIARHFGVDKVIEYNGYVTHSQSVANLQKADVLLFLLSELYSEGMVTGKLYEYLASGKPVLAFAGKGEARRLIELYAGCQVFNKDTIEDASRQLVAWFKLWKSNALDKKSAKIIDLDVFNRRSQTARLAEYLHNLIPKD